MMINIKLKKIRITNLNQVATSHNISIITTNGKSSINCLTERMEFKSGIPTEVNLTPPQ